jgi:3-oxoacyl-[acyl-carrier protein] reductase
METAVGADAKNISGKVAVIVGGSGGIGAATARLLAGEGASVAITWRSGASAAERVLEGLPGGGHSAHQADVADSASLAALVAEVRERHGRADILVNTAGFTKAVPAQDLDALDDAFIDEMFRVNWRGVFATTRAFRPLLAERDDGLIVNVSSIAAVSGVGSNVAYAAVKAATDTMTKSLARALAPAIRVMAVSPGVVATDFVPGRDAAALEKIAAGIPLRRVAQPEDVARAIVALATHLTYSTGSILTIDGGRAL